MSDNLLKIVDETCEIIFMIETVTENRYNLFEYCRYCLWFERLTFQSRSIQLSTTSQQNRFYNFSINLAGTFDEIS